MKSIHFQTCLKSIWLFNLVIAFFEVYRTNIVTIFRQVFINVLAVLGLLCIAMTPALAQLTGIKTIPGDYSTIASAVLDLNFNGVGSGGVVFNVAAGHTEISDIPEITASGTFDDQIVFQKYGMGPNPEIQPFSPGIFASSSTVGNHGDGMIIINGGDYITFNGIDLTTDPSFTGGGMYEYGFYTKKFSSTDACKNITIKNCTITLNKAVVYSFGIFISNISGISYLTVTSSGGRSEDIKIYDNDISNAYGGVLLYGYADPSSPFNFYDKNIKVGENGGNMISNYGGGNSTAYGVYTAYQKDLKVNNNNIIGGDNTTGSLYGIFISTSLNSNVDVDNNSISLTTHAMLSTTQVVGILLNTGTGTSSTHNVTNNTISNFVRPASSSTQSAFITYPSSGPFNLNISGNVLGSSTLQGMGNLIGIRLQSGATNVAIVNNTISDIFCTQCTSAFNGIYHGAPNPNQAIISGNIVHSLTSNGSGEIIGIQTSSALSVEVCKNKIYNITNNHSSGVVYGLKIDPLFAQATTINVYNNLIGELKAPNSNMATDAIRGINITSTLANSSFNISYNTVLFSATSSGTNFSTSGLYHEASGISTTGSLNLRNNIICNLSTPMGTGKTSAFRRSSTLLDNFGSISDHNLLYAGSPDSNHVIFYDGTNSDQLLTDYQDRVIPREANSISHNPSFISTIGSESEFLHIDPAVGTELESSGIGISGINDDYDDDIRHGSGGYGGNGDAPDIGADEGEFMYADLTAPLIKYTPLLFTCMAGDRSLNGVFISDVTGVPETGNLKPRIYYKKGFAGNWFSSQGSLSSGTVLNGLWNFTVIASDMGGVAVGDTIYYYVIAQDSWTPHNITSIPSPGLSAIDVNNIISPPTLPNSYFISEFLSGAYLVGTGQYFTSLSQAINAYNNHCLSGPVVFELTDANYTVGEIFPIVILAHQNASIGNTLTIRPAIGTAVTLSGTSGATTSALIKFGGADFVTIDGLNTGGASLTIENTSITSGTTVLWLSSTGLGAGARNNTIRNTHIKAGVAQNTTVTSTYGIVVGGSTLSGIAGVVNPGNDNDNTRIERNVITKVRYGIFISGGSVTNPNTGTIISENILGPTSFGSESIGKSGIVVREDFGVQIINNTLRFIGGDYANTSSGTDRIAITLGNNANWPPTFSYIRNAVITGNNIHDIVEERNSSAVGIAIAAYDGSNETNNLIANNFIFNIKANGTGSDRSIGIGMTVSKLDKVEFNTIYMAGDTDPNASATSPSQSNYTFFIASSSVINPVILDNILYMDLLSSSTPSIKNACINVPSAFQWGTGASDYNNLYFIPGNTQSYTASIGGTTGTFYLTLNNWQTVSSQDSNSVTIAPVFTSTTDLHLTNVNVLLDNVGTPIDSLEYDFDAKPRNFLTPDMGADEFTTGCMPLVINTNGSGVGSLSDVVTCIPPGEAITFDSGLLGDTITLTSGEIVIDKSLAIWGLGKTNLTISGNNASRIFYLQPGKILRLRDIALKNGSEVVNGGAIFVEGNLTLRSVLLENNFENGIPKSMTIISPGELNIEGDVDIKE